VPVGSWTMANEGAKKVPLAGVADHCGFWHKYGRRLFATTADLPK